MTYPSGSDGAAAAAARKARRLEQGRTALELLGACCIAAAAALTAWPLFIAWLGVIFIAASWQAGR